MVCVNELGKSDRQSRKVLEPLVVLLSPFAPYLAEYLWARLGNAGCLLREAQYPVYDASLAAEDLVTYPVSVNGKVRTRLDFPAQAGSAEVEAGVLADEVVIKWLDGKGPKKVIVVPGRIVNIVV